MASGAFGRLRGLCARSGNRSGTFARVAQRSGERAARSSGSDTTSRAAAGSRSFRSGKWEFVAVGSHGGELVSWRLERSVSLESVFVAGQQRGGAQAGAGDRICPLVDSTGIGRGGCGAAATGPERRDQRYLEFKRYADRQSKRGTPYVRC